MERDHTTQHYLEFLEATQNDKVAAAILTLAHNIAAIEGLRMWHNADPDSAPIRIQIDGEMNVDLKTPTSPTKDPQAPTPYPKTRRMGR